MTTIQQLFQQAQLAEASYTLFDKINYTDSGQVQAALDVANKVNFSGSFSTAQATEFVRQWRAVDHIPDTASGFSATLFERLDSNGNGIGEFNLAIRGSNDFADFVADMNDVFLDGVALDQLVDLYNYWQRLSTPTTITYTAAKLETLVTETAALNAAYLLGTAAGLAYEAELRARPEIIIDYPTRTVKTIQFVDSSTLGDATLRQGAGFQTEMLALSASGHSLGGHLAMAFTRLFPGLNASAVGVNGMGFLPTNSDVDHLFAMLGGAPGFDSGKILNAYGFAGPEFAAQDNYLVQVGAYQGIYIESALLGHSAMQMTDSLAVYDLFAKIDPLLNTTDPAVGIGKITDILKAGSNKPALSLEAALNVLRILFKDPAGPNPSVTATDIREQFYQNLYNPDFQNRISGYTNLLSVDSLVDKDATTIEANAFGNLAYRYALKALNPFAVMGEAGIYDQFNQSSELDVYDSATGSGTLTSQWVSDRAKFLAWKMAINTVDTNWGINTASSDSAWYQDRELGQNAYVLSSTFPQLVTGALRSPGAIEGYLIKTDAQRIFFGADTAGEALDGGGKSDYLYGGGGDDRLNGLAQDDYLQGDAGGDLLAGGTGSDILVGGKDNDVLGGGLGNDIYVWNKGDGFDAITDAREADGFKQGTIQFLNQALNGTKTQVSPDNPVEFSDGLGVTYQFFGPEGGEGTLFISKAGEAGDLEVRGFRSGDFGIDLGPVAAIQKTDKLGTADADNGADPGSPIYNDAPNEKLYGLDGDDGFLIATAGTEAYGGMGNDFIYAPVTVDDGGHKLYGEAGSDILISWSGSDQLFGGLDDDALSSGNEHDYLEGSRKGNRLFGQARNNSHFASVKEVV